MEERRALGEDQQPANAAAHRGISRPLHRHHAACPPDAFTPSRQRESVQSLYGAPARGQPGGGSFPSLMDVPPLGVPPSKNYSILSRNTFGRDMAQAKGTPPALCPITAAALLRLKTAITAPSRPGSSSKAPSAYFLRMSQPRHPNPTLERSAHENGFRLPNARAPLSSPSVHSRAAQERAPARFRGFCWSRARPVQTCVCAHQDR